MAAVMAALFSIVASLSTARASIVANDAAGDATSSKLYHACKPVFSFDVSDWYPFHITEFISSLDNARFHIATFARLPNQGYKSIYEFLPIRAFVVVSIVWLVDKEPTTEPSLYSFIVLPSYVPTT